MKLSPWSIPSMEERMGALSVTGNKKYREAFEPMIGNIRFAKYE